MNSHNDHKSVSNRNGTTRNHSPFGYPDYWDKIHTEFGKQLAIIQELFTLCDESIREAEIQATEKIQMVVCSLTRATRAGASEAIILCGNGCGAGAMKIVRGMYESAWTSEYLRRNPSEVQDYLEFGKVIAWNRVRFSQKHRLDQIPKETVEQVKDAFETTNKQSKRGDGRVRQQWSKKSIRKIAESVGREEQYELPYSIACSIHHGNLEGILAYFDCSNEEAMPSPPPSLAWVKQALLAAHGNLYYAVDTLNKCCNLEFQQRIEGARQQYIDVWSSRGIKAEN